MKKLLHQAQDAIGKFIQEYDLQNRIKVWIGVLGVWARALKNRFLKLSFRNKAIVSGAAALLFAGCLSFMLLFSSWLSSAGGQGGSAAGAAAAENALPGRALLCTVGFPLREMSPGLAEVGGIQMQAVMDSLIRGGDASIDGMKFNVRIALDGEKWGCLSGAEVNNPHAPKPLRIRYFDEGGNYLGHFTTREYFLPEWARDYTHMFLYDRNNIDVIPVPEEGVKLTYSINARDASFVKLCEISFAEIDAATVTNKDWIKNREQYFTQLVKSTHRQRMYFFGALVKNSLKAIQCPDGSTVTDRSALDDCAELIDSEGISKDGQMHFRLVETYAAKSDYRPLDKKVTLHLAEGHTVTFELGTIKYVVNDNSYYDDVKGPDRIVCGSYIDENTGIRTVFGIQKMLERINQLPKM